MKLMKLSDITDPAERREYWLRAFDASWRARSTPAQEQRVRIALDYLRGDDSGPQS